jgi:SAM-dependent methyltransferase
MEKTLQAARNGGFEDRNGNGVPDLAVEYDRDGDGNPDNYFEGMKLLDFMCEPLPYAKVFRGAEVYGYSPWILDYREIGYPIEEYGIKYRALEEFPTDFFDAAISNCGIAITDFGKGLNEILRALRPGGVLVFNDWHLIDVKPHRIFGEVLGKYRTACPSPQLVRERSALAGMESFHHSLGSKAQLGKVHDAGFEDAKLTNRRYKIRMPGIKDYLKMRLCRATIRREISEMSRRQRGIFQSELRERLHEFVEGDALVFDWDVFYIRAKRPKFY